MYITVVKCKTEKINKVQRNLEVKVYNSCIPSTSLSACGEHLIRDIHTLLVEPVFASIVECTVHQCLHALPVELVKSKSISAWARVPHGTYSN